MTEKSDKSVAAITERSRPEMFLLGLLYLFAFCLPWSKSAVTVLTSAMFLALVVHLLIRKEFAARVQQALLQPLSVPFLLLFGIAAIGIVHSQRFTEGWAIANKVLTLPFVYLLFATILDIVARPGERDDIEQRVLMVFLAGVLILDIIAFLTYFGIIGNKQYVLPLAPMHMHHIWFSNVNALAIYTAVAHLLYGKIQYSARKGLILVLFILAAIAAVLFSLSRTAWFGILLTGIIVAFFFMPRKKMFVVFLTIIILACLLAYLTSPLIRDRMHTAVSDMSVYSSGQTEITTSLGDRFYMWKGAIRMFLSSPLFGVGTGDYNAGMAAFVKNGELPERLLTFNQPHNMYLFTLATNGLIGIGALLYMFWSVFRYVLPSIRTGTSRFFGFLAFAATIHFMIAGLFDSLFNIFILRYTFVFIIAMTVTHSAERPVQENHQS